MIRDKLHIYNNCEDLRRECTFCSEQTHQLNDCPYITKPLDRDRVLRFLMISPSQERKKFNRKNPICYVLIKIKKFSDSEI